MAAMDNPKTLGRARLSFANEAEIDEFARMLERFERGDLTPEQWRVFRLGRGTYGQRQAEDAHMIRVKIPQGILTADALVALGDVADRYSRGFGHVTTRQNLQFHFVKVHDVEPAMRRLAEAGLTTREACGNSVRNVTGCPYAGVSTDEIFDPTPYADALARYLLRHPLSGALPRKFKMAFEGCPDDHARTAIHDIGWRARISNGRRGFRVVVGGGTAIMCRSAATLFEFVEAGRTLQVAEAVLRVFHQRGDYEHKQRNRMKFLIKSLGWERWKAEVEAAFTDVTREGIARLPFDPEDPPVEGPPHWQREAAPDLREIAALVSAARLTGPGIRPRLDLPPESIDAAYERWRTTNVRAQRQRGYVTATVTVPLGDLTGAQLRIVATLARAFADGCVRTSIEQNLLFRWIQPERLPAFYRSLAAAGLGLADAATVADVTSCPGAESCKLAVTQSRGLGRMLGEYVRSRPSLIGLAGGVDVKISGCPNGCGQHHIAGIGFQGSLRKVGDRAVPQYFVLVGGGTSGDHASFGRVAAKVPARRCATALERLLRLYASDRLPSQSAEAYFQNVDLGRIKSLLADLQEISPATAAADDFIDLGETKAFMPETLDGECSV